MCRVWEGMLLAMHNIPVYAPITTQRTHYSREQKVMIRGRIFCLFLASGDKLTDPSC